MSSLHQRKFFTDVLDRVAVLTSLLVYFWTHTRQHHLQARASTSRCWHICGWSREPHPPQSALRRHHHHRGAQREISRICRVQRPAWHSLLRISLCLTQGQAVLSHGYSPDLSRA